jgi:phosphatidylglycerophosphate synthase
MSAYVPRDRRPIADVLRRTADMAVRACVKSGIHPDLISYSSIVVSGSAAVCFWQAGAFPGLLIPAVGLCYVRLWLNMLDGMVAIAANKASRTGEIANELPDRVSDVLIFAGIAHSGLCSPICGYWAAIGALLVAYVGTLGQAVGAQREFSGLMTKPFRMVALHLGAWTTLACLWLAEGRIRYAGLTVLDWTNLAIIAGCVQTAALRLQRILRCLRRQVSPDGLPAATGANP